MWWSSGRVVLDAAGVQLGPAGSELVTWLLAVCAALLAVGCVWLLVAVVACTWEVLAHGTPRPSGSSLLRPRVVQACVAACLGATVLGSPAARAQSPPTPDGERRHRVLPATVTGARILDGLPVPDRTSGRLVAPTRADAGSANRHLGSRRMAERPPADRPPADRDLADRRLEVRPGDSLWRLTAGLLPRGAPAHEVATGWRLLYAANRAVIGADPDLLRPGQSLRVPPDLLDRPASLSPSPDRRSR